MVQQPDCSIRMVGKTVPDAGYSLAMRKGSTYKNILSQLIRNYKYDGTLERLQMKWFSNNCFDQIHGEHRAAEQAGIISFGGLLIIVFGICVLVVPCLFCCELLMRKSYTKKDTSRDLCSQNNEKALLIIPSSSLTRQCSQSSESR